MNEDKNEALENPAVLESENVHRVYDEIANHFSETRHTPWPQVEKFVENFSAGSVLIDIGCGNGKYLHLNQSILKVAKLAMIPINPTGRDSAHTPFVLFFLDRM